MSRKSGDPVLRLFLSSTFQDFRAEREALHNKVFPALTRDAAGLGLEFRVVDLRWGITDAAAHEQQSVRVCMEQVRLCANSPLRPNFLFLLGNRYGWRPLPPTISIREWRFVESYLRGKGNDLGRLLELYRLDENAIPPVRELQSFDVVLTSGEDPEELERHLRELLVEALTDLRLSARRRLSFGFSVTEQEIETALASGSDRVLGVIRTIHGLPVDARSSCYFDDPHHGAIDLDARDRLRSLKRRLKALPRIIHCRAQWNSEKLTDDHISKFCNDVHRVLSVAIQEAAESRRRPRSSKDDQDQFVKSQANVFVGREQYLQGILRYVKSGPTRPLVITGCGGVGKTALIAKAVETVRTELPRHLLVYRFVGAAPEFSNGASVLQGLCKEIGEEYGKSGVPVTDDFEQLCELFRECLRLAKPARPLVVFIDAIDQFSLEDPARRLSWIDATLSEHARLVVSSRLDDLPEVATSKAEIRELDRMSIKDAEMLLDLWLAGSQGRERGWTGARRLTARQRRTVLEAFAKVGLPLYLRLAYHEARGWRSEPDDQTLPSDVSGLLRSLFGRLSEDRNFGQVFVNRALSSLAVSREGLSEGELLAILAQDVNVIDDLNALATKSPLVNEVPSVIWARFYRELEEYLTFRTQETWQLLSFFHREFGEAVVETFMRRSRIRQKAHGQLADYFEPRKREKTDRPTYDVRQLVELSHQQLHARRWKDLCETLGDPTFVLGKIERLGHQSLLKEYEIALDTEGVRKARGLALKLRLLRTVAATVRLSSHNLAVNPSGARAQLVGRLRDVSSPNVQGFVRKLLSTERGQPSLCPRYGSLASADARLLQVFQVPAVNSSCMSADGRRAAVVSREEQLAIWDLEAGVTVARPDVEATVVVGIPDSSCAIVGTAQGQLVVFDLENAIEIRRLRHGRSRVTALAVGAGGRFAVSGSRLGILKVWDLKKWQATTLRKHRATVNAVGISADGKVIVGASWDYRFDGARDFGIWRLRGEPRLLPWVGENHIDDVFALAVSPDGTLALSGAASGDCTIRLWDTKSRRCLQTFHGHDGPIRCVVFHPNGTELLSTSGDTSVRVWKLRTGRETTAIWGHLDGVQSVALDSAGNHALTGSDDGTLKLWNLNGHKRGSSRRTRVQGSRVQGFSIAVRSGTDQVFSVLGEQMVRGFDLDTQRQIFRKRVHTRRKDLQIQGLRLSPEGEFGVTWAMDNENQDVEIAVWDTGTGDLVIRWREQELFLDALAVFPKARRVVVHGETGVVRIRDLQQGRLVRQRQRQRQGIMAALAVSPNGQRLAWGSMENHRVEVWDGAMGKCVKKWRAHDKTITSLNFVDSNELLTASEDGTAKLWSMRSANALAVFGGHGDGVNWADHANDQSQVLTASTDTSVRLWSRLQPDTLAQFYGDNSMKRVAMTASGLVLAEEDGGVVHVLERLA